MVSIYLRTRPPHTQCPQNNASVGTSPDVLCHISTMPYAGDQPSSVNLMASVACFISSACVGFSTYVATSIASFVATTVV